MSKSEKMLEAYKDMLNEVKEVEQTILSLPRGYISTKTISGHTYHYLQWREGNRVLSSYVNDALLAIVQQKIVIRKANEELLKILKKDLQKTEKALLKAGVKEEEIQALK